MNARETALNVLLPVYKDGIFYQEALDNALQKAGETNDTDRRFIRHLTKGVLRRTETLYAVLKRNSSVKPEKMKPVVRVILSMGLYELLFMDTRDYAAVSEYVNLTKKRGFQGLSGFVNGVLRHAAGEGRKLLEPLSEREKIGVSAFLWKKLNDWYPEKRAEIARALFTEHEDTCIRRMVSKADEERFLEAMADEDIRVVKTGITSDTYEVLSGHDFLRTHAFKRGLFYVQDLSSAVSGDIVRDLFAYVSPDFQALDTCASPGGKSIHLLDMMRGNGQLVSCDLSEKKTDRIKENISRYGFKNVTVKVQDALEFVPEWEESFHLVVADVPCSGIGVISGKPDIALNFTEEGLQSLVTLQKNVLSNVSRYVKKGGTLIYSTCTINPAENEGNVRAFLAEHPDFEPVDFSGNLPEEWQKESVKEGMLTLLPGNETKQGFFMARLKRKK